MNKVQNIRGVAGLFFGKVIFQVVIILCFTGFSTVLIAQKNILIPVDSWQNQYIKRLQQRGHLLSLNPSVLPYSENQLLSAIENSSVEEASSAERKWLDLLRESITEKSSIDSTGLKAGGKITAGARRSGSARLNVLSPLGDPKPVLPRAQFHGYMYWKGLVANAGFTFDWFYDLDPDGNDVARRLYSRSEDTYIGYHNGLLDVYLGRYNHHWSLYGQEGGLLTDNARSFDHLNFKFGSETISFRSILGELDSLNPSGFFSGYRFEPGSIRRYAFLHRVDWRPTQNFMLSLMEGELYYSETAGIQFRNLLPLQILFFESLNEPINNNSNLFVGVSVWGQKGKTTLYSQFILDDFSYRNREESNENGEFKPITFALNSSIYVSDIAGSSGFGLQADFVSTNSYSAALKEDQWTYLNRGLATFTSDYIKLKLFTDIYLVRGFDLHFKPYVTAYFKGIKDFHTPRISLTPEGEPINSILTGTIERTIRPALYLRYQPLKEYSKNSSSSFSWWLDADIGVNFIQNHNNIEGHEAEEFSALIQLFGRFSF